jgi:hypothetical protein
MATHTPGPWYIRNNGRHDGDNTVTSKEADICEMDGGTNDDCVVRANATLIAAAPELLDALRECVTDDNAACWKDDESIMRRIMYISRIAREAIAKAEGKA